MDMETLIHQNDRRPTMNKGLVVGILVGVVVIAAAVVVLLMQPSMEEQKAAVLADAIHEDDPRFVDLTNDIVIETGQNTVESPNAFGSISMYIVGNVKNKGERVYNGLSVNAAVLDQQNNVLKDKDVLVVPTQRGSISPGEVIPITLEIAGFKRTDDRANIRWKVTAIRLPQN
jgi:gas vesicle protein